MNRPITTLFMLISVDGKISTGSTDQRDVDRDFPRLPGIKEGLSQYYEIEQSTDLASLNSGRVLAKVGINKPQKQIIKTPVSFLVVDNKPHLTQTGIKNLLKKGERLFLITTNKAHPAFKMKDEHHLEILFYQKQIDFEDLFHRLKKKYRINRITIQTGGTLNAILLRKNLIDRISVVVAPALIGGKDTPSLIDGRSLASVKDLRHIKALKLIQVKKLKGSYLHLMYRVINKPTID